MKIFGVLLLLILCCACARSAAEPQTVDDVMAGCVSSKDGNHKALEARIRIRLENPESMVTHGTYYRPDDSLDDDQINLRLDYSYVDGAGETVRADAFAVMNLSCHITEIVDSD